MSGKMIFKIILALQKGGNLISSNMKQQVIRTYIFTGTSYTSTFRVRVYKVPWLL